MKENFRVSTKEYPLSCLKPFGSSMMYVLPLLLSTNATYSQEDSIPNFYSNRKIVQPPADTLRRRADWGLSAYATGLGASSSSSATAHPTINSKAPDENDLLPLLIQDPILCQSEYGEFTMRVRGITFSAREQFVPAASVLTSILPDLSPNEQVYDYFHISLEGNFIPKSVLNKKKSDERHFQHYRAHRYILGAHPVKWGSRELWDEIDNSQTIAIMGWSPDTPTDGEVKTSSSINLNIGGTIGVQGQQPALSLSPGTAFSHSVERTIKDVRILNKTSTQHSKAEWEFDISNFSTNPINSSGPSVSAFNPLVQWVWRVNRKEAISNKIYKLQGGKYYFSFLPELAVEIDKFFHMRPTKHLPLQQARIEKVVLIPIPAEPPHNETAKINISS